MTNEEAREHMDMLIAHKDKALETHPYFKRCDSCIHSEERDGSNCYECIKGIDDKFEAQTTDKCKGCYYNDGEAHAECVVCDKKAQPTDADCISREAVIRLIEQYPNIIGNRFSGLISDIKHLSPVTPTNEDIKEAYLKGYDYGVKDWFKSKTQPCEDAISREAVIENVIKCTDMNEDTMEVLENKVKALPFVYPERPKGKWIEVDDNDSHGWGAHRCHVCSECKDYYTTSAYEMKYCPNCGAEMEDGEE